MTRGRKRLYIAYTRRDLLAHAVAVSEVARALGWGVDFDREWPATDEALSDGFRRRIQRCDALLALFAFHLGSCLPGPPGRTDARTHIEEEISIAEHEGVPVLAFLVSEKAVWPVEHIDAITRADRAERVSALRQHLMERSARMFETLPELQQAIIITLRRHREGGQSASIAAERLRPRRLPIAEAGATLAVELQSELSRRGWDGSTLAANASVDLDLVQHLLAGFPPPRHPETGAVADDRYHRLASLLSPDPRQFLHAIRTAQTAPANEPTGADLLRLAGPMASDTTNVARAIRRLAMQIDDGSVGELWSALARLPNAGRAGADVTAALTGEKGPPESAAAAPLPEFPTAAERIVAQEVDVEHAATQTLLARLLLTLAEKSAPAVHAWLNSQGAQP